MQPEKHRKCTEETLSSFSSTTSFSLYFPIACLSNRRQHPFFFFLIFTFFIWLLGVLVVVHGSSILVVTFCFVLFLIEARRIFNLPCDIFVLFCFVFSCKMQTPS